MFGQYITVQYVTFMRFIIPEINFELYRRIIKLYSTTRHVYKPRKYFQVWHFFWNNFWSSWCIKKVYFFHFRGSFLNNWGINVGKMKTCMVMLVPLFLFVITHIKTIAETWNFHRILIFQIFKISWLFLNCLFGINIGIMVFEIFFSRINWIKLFWPNRNSRKFKIHH